MKIIAQAGQEPPITTPEGAQRRLLSYGGGMMAVQFTFDADMTAPIHNHPHEQIGYVIEGEIDLHMEHEGEMRVTRLGAGCSYYVAPNVRHGIVTRTPSVLIDCFSPIRADFLATNNE
ncbi:MAG: cupin domain-containing protein [Chloroflexales bacterium]|nr:cupin domain-containing protein [Chloroflexales bacterium]